MTRTGKIVAVTAPALAAVRCGIRACTRSAVAFVEVSNALALITVGIAGVPWLHPIRNEWVQIARLRLFSAGRGSGSINAAISIGPGPVSALSMALIQ
jgi:hypothetical protein